MALSLGRNPRDYRGAHSDRPGTDGPFAGGRMARCRGFAVCQPKPGGGDMSHLGTIRPERSEFAAALGTVEGAMTKSVASVSRNMPASEALAYLIRHGVGGAPVVEGDRVVGVVPPSDLAAPHPYARETGPFLRPHSGGSEWQVRDLMTESPV